MTSTDIEAVPIIDLVESGVFPGMFIDDQGRYYRVIDRVPRMLAGDAAKVDQAYDALREYNEAPARGEEPEYPAWADRVIRGANRKEGGE